MATKKLVQGNDLYPMIVCRLNERKDVGILGKLYYKLFPTKEPVRPARQLFGCLCEMKNGNAYNISALLHEYGSLHKEPYIELVENERFATFIIHKEHIHEISKIVVYAELLGSYDTWKPFEISVEIVDLQEKEIQLQVGGCNAYTPFCSFSAITFSDGAFSIDTSIHYPNTIQSMALIHELNHFKM